jgi:hypothetical protein
LPKIAAKLRAGVTPPPKSPDDRAVVRAAESAAAEAIAKLRGAVPRSSRSPKKFHLDKRIGALLAVDAAEDDDDLLTTNEMANWLQVSPQWLAIGRHRGYGPPFKRYGALIRYQRGDARRWLKARTFQSTAEYDPRRALP